MTTDDFFYFKTDDDFIEVTIKPTEIKADDELFPASIFTSEVAKSVVTTPKQDASLEENKATVKEDNMVAESIPTALEDIPQVPDVKEDDNEFDGMSKVSYRQIHSRTSF